MDDSPEVVTTTSNPNPLLQSDPVLAELLARLESGQAEKVQNIVEHRVQVVQLTVRELKAALQSNPGHAHAADFANAIASLKDDQIIHVEQPTLQALIHNRPLIVRVETIDGVPVCTKSVG